MDKIIAENETRLTDAMLSSDCVALDTLLSDDLIFTNHFGQPMRKQDDIEAHRSGFVNISSIEQSEQKIKLFGDIAAVSVISKIQGSFGGTQADATLRFTRVWQQQTDGQWQVVVAHSTLVA